MALLLFLFHFSLPPPLTDPDPHSPRSINGRRVGQGRTGRVKNTIPFANIPLERKRTVRVTLSAMGIWSFRSISYALLDFALVCVDRSAGCIASNSLCPSKCGLCGCWIDPLGSKTLPKQPCKTINGRIALLKFTVLRPSISLYLPYV